MKISDKNYDLFKSIMIAIVSGVVVVISQQLFFKENINFEFKKELIKENYVHYSRILNFADIRYRTVIGYPTTIIQPHITHYIDRETKKTIKSDTSIVSIDTTMFYEVPKIVVDRDLQKSWFSEVELIKKNKNHVDQRLYFSFLDVVELVNKNPFPDLDSISVKKSVWANQELVKRWTNLNNKLWNDCNSFINLNF